MSDSKQRDSHVRQKPFQQLPQGIRQQLRDVRRDVNRRLTNAKEAVYESDATGKQNSQDPGSDCRAWHGRVIVGGDNASDFGVGAVGDDESCLNLHFGDLLLMFFWVRKNVIII